MTMRKKQSGVPAYEQVPSLDYDIVIILRTQNEGL